jgi:hypothetical protein
MINKDCDQLYRVHDINGCKMHNEVLDEQGCTNCQYGMCTIENLNRDNKIMTILKNEPNYTSVVLSDEQCKRIVEMLRWR